MSRRIVLRMVAPVLAISALLIAVGSTAAWYVHHVNKQVSLLLHDNLGLVLATHETVLAVRDVRLELSQFLSTGNRQNLRAALAAQSRVQHALDGVERRSTGTDLEQLQRIRTAYAPLVAKLDDLAGQPESANVRQEASGVYDELSTQVLAPLLELFESSRQHVSKVSENNKMLADRIGLGLLILGSSGAMAGLLAGFGIARGVSRSLVQLSVPIRDTAGTLNEVVGPIQISTQAGLPEMERAMRRIADQTGEVVRRLQETQREALRRERLAAVGQLAAGMAHELRNPLTSMRILVQAASEQPDGAGLTGQDLAVLEEEIARLEHTIQTFLDFARPPLPEKRQIDVRHWIDQTLRLVSTRAGQQGVTIHWNVPQQPLWIDGDPIQLRQVILNLLLNALDAVPQGGAITIEAVHEPASAESAAHRDGAPRLVLRVSDTGPGLPPELGERIFEPFVSTKETGLGLGLSICRGIVESHGGQIEAVNGSHGGAVFKICLPLPAGAGSRGPDASQPRDTHQTQPRDGQQTQPTHSVHH